jgi:hypothetical protein
MRRASSGSRSRPRPVMRTRPAGSRPSRCAGVASNTSSISSSSSGFSPRSAARMLASSITLRSKRTRTLRVSELERTSLTPRTRHSLASRTLLPCPSHSGTCTRTRPGRACTMRGSSRANSSGNPGNCQPLIVADHCRQGSTHLVDLRPK